MNLIKKNGQNLASFPVLFDDFFSRNLFDWGQSNFAPSGTTVPAVNIRETNDAFEVEMAAPGMKKEDFKIELEGNNLLITSEKKNETEEENSRYFRKEFSYQSFQRSFTLSKDVVDADKIIAKYEHGVLQLMIPKKEEAKQKPPRQIKIS